MTEKIIDILLEYVETDDEITEDTSLKLDLNLSSFDLACIGNDISNEFDLDITPDTFRDCDTVGKLAEFIKASK